MYTKFRLFNYDLIWHVEIFHDALVISKGSKMGCLYILNDSTIVANAYIDSHVCGRYLVELAKLSF